VPMLICPYRGRNQGFQRPAEMRKLLLVTLFISSGWIQNGVSKTELVGSKIELLEGSVLGAAFYEQKSMFVVQQLVLSTANGGRQILSARRVSSWSLSRHSMLTTRVLGPSPSHNDTYPCGRIEVSPHTNKIFLCSPGEYLEVLDPDTLNTVAKFASRQGQYIYDFAVDDQNGRVFVLALMGDDSPRLTTYSLADGSQQQETLLPATREGRMLLALVPKTGQVAVAVKRSGRGAEKSDIYSCGSEAVLACIHVASTDGVSQMSMLGQELLVATNTFADRKEECLISVDLNRHLASRTYCSPTAGVHYAVGVAANTYVVAFTGRGKRLWWKEQNEVVENSFSLWRAEDPHIVAVARDQTNYGGMQTIVRLFASSTEPLFIAYVGESNVLYVYSIAERQ
jgi:hypothetical protein